MSKRFKIAIDSIIYTTPLIEHFRTEQEWLVPSKLLVNLPEEKLLESSLLPRLVKLIFRNKLRFLVEFIRYFKFLIFNLYLRLLVNLHPQLEVSRSLIVTVQELLLSVRSAVTKNRLSFSSENSPSNDLFVRSLRTSKPISAFSLPQLALFRYF